MICGYGSQDALPFRPVKEGELYFQEDREVNLVELALATNIPKGCAEAAVRGMWPPTAGPSPRNSWTSLGCGCLGLEMSPLPLGSSWVSAPCSQPWGTLGNTQATPSPSSPGLGLLRII